MINPIQSISLNHYSHKNSVPQRRQQDSRQLQDLSGYAVGQAILVRNNISFRGCAEPIDVTPLYNKRIEGKDHLDLPNIHVYEFPDTNLQVFIAENINQQEGDIQAFLFAGKSGIKNSPIKDELIRIILNKQLRQQSAGASLFENNTGLYSININTNKIQDIVELNSIINNLTLSDEELKDSKIALLKKLRSNEYQLATQEFGMLNSKYPLESAGEVVNEITNINKDDIIQYYDNNIKNSELQYFIVINPKKTKKSELLNTINSNINSKYQRHLNTKFESDFILNKSLKVLNNTMNDSSITTIYPYPEGDIRDACIAHFTNLLLIFLLPPYHGEDSCTSVIKSPLSTKTDLRPKYTVHELKFDIPRVGFVNLNPQNARDMQKTVFKIILDTDFSNTLTSIKEEYKKILIEDCQARDLYYYGYDVFKIDEIYDSITQEDIKDHIQKYLIDQEPVIKAETKGYVA